VGLFLQSKHYLDAQADMDYVMRNHVFATVSAFFIGAPQFALNGHRMFYIGPHTDLPNIRPLSRLLGLGDNQQVADCLFLYSGLIKESDVRSSHSFSHTVKLWGRVSEYVKCREKRDPTTKRCLGYVIVILVGASDKGRHILYVDKLALESALKHLGFFVTSHCIAQRHPRLAPVGHISGMANRTGTQRTINDHGAPHAYRPQSNVSNDGVDPWPAPGQQRRVANASSASSLDNGGHNMTSHTVGVRGVGPQRQSYSARCGEPISSMRTSHTMHHLIDETARPSRGHTNYVQISTAGQEEAHSNEAATLLGHGSGVSNDGIPVRIDQSNNPNVPKVHQ
jgi:hypothetical protein